jgi:ADP-heptose:LPS heptosyltransferase
VDRTVAAEDSRAPRNMLGKKAPPCTQPSARITFETMIPDTTQFYALTREARKIMVVDIGFLGDTVHLIPALWEIKRNYVRAEIQVVTTRIGAHVLKLAPCVDRIWVLGLAAGKGSLWEQWRVLGAVRRDRPEVAFNFIGNDRSVILTALTGARWRLAHAAGRRHVWNRWLIPYWVPRQNPDLVNYEQRRLVLAACGLELGPIRFDLNVDELAFRRATELVPPSAIHVSVSSSNITREWPLEHHVNLFRLLWAAQPELKVVASGSPNLREQERLRRLAAEIKDPRLVVMPPDLTIAQLAGILGRCRLHLGPDSGVVHLAMALNVPTVSFYRQQGAYKSFMPSGPRHKTISVPCGCIDHHVSRCEQLGRSECFATIEPARIAALILEQLALFP